LRTLMQEAECDICLFMPFVPQADLSEILPLMVSSMSSDPTLGMLAPCLRDETHILAAGQDCPSALQSHRLEQSGEAYDYEFSAESLFYLYQKMSLTAWQEFASRPLQVNGLPLLISALRKEAYLSLPWVDQPWSLAWLAEDISLALKQQQYRLQVLPQPVRLNRAEAFWLDGGKIPEGFKEKWTGEFKSQIFKLYHHHGWQQSGTVFNQIEQAPQESIESYYAEKVAKAS